MMTQFIQLSLSAVSVTGWTDLSQTTCGEVRRVQEMLTIAEVSESNAKSKNPHQITLLFYTQMNILV